MFQRHRSQLVLGLGGRHGRHQSMSILYNKDQGEYLDTVSPYLESRRFLLFPTSDMQELPVEPPPPRSRYR